ncbi:MAG: PAS domain S-box protein [Deltaproteobacteria bacterium]|nr:PAS domain S-box protein [Deltaproteobacteria bacterium]
MEPELSKEKLYDSIIEGHPYPLFIVDKDLKIREFNPAAEKLTGWQKGEVIGKSCSEILKSDICEENSPFIEPSQEERTCVGQDTAIKTKSGQEVDVFFSATSFWSDGQFTGGLGIFIEATEIKKAEIQRQNIISMFTHDLKAPVAIAGAYLFRVIDGKAGELTDRQMQYLTAAKKEILRLDGYIHRFLDAVRFQMGQIPLYFMPCSIEKTLHELVEGFQVKASEKNISITRDLPKVLPPSVPIDKQQFERAVSNLLDNAIKYSPEESEVMVRAVEKEDSILFEIRDQGQGISQEDLPHIFEYFYRCKDKAGQVAGAGLGLAIVKGIIESHGGKIWAKSAMGKGTSFFFTIPKMQTGKNR